MIIFIYKLYINVLFRINKYFNLKIDFEKKQNLFFSLIKKFKSNGKFNIGDVPFKFKLNSDVSKCLVLNGEFEKKEIEVCLSYINNNSIILDIGANIGFHTIYFAQKAKQGLIFAFEPAKSTYHNLLQNIIPFKNIVPLKIALSNNSQIADFFVASDDAYSSLIDTGRKKIIDMEKVVVFDLDTFLLPLNLEKIDLIKIDVEGLEYNAILGMAGSLKRYMPVLFVEIFKGNNDNYDPMDTINFLHNLGYKSKVFIGYNMVDFTSHTDEHHNYLFIPPDRKILNNA
jgi:FkbM family methyltransferase